ncbi:hypothetical protein SAMN05216266_113161 [Amycolatopsis marina]|uniref:Energy-coupling factor transport system substrate-specific component n=1 Tax=Amycolatopsis marina TaxID=490629 RepID=A0A1I1BJ99_9PSEU|nr:hypothetical protein [Amycolatopsis marina]SFB48560.1 hypothetical protein SAMN05216266_113161 [Amycolatopsis marina]
MTGNEMAQSRVRRVTGLSLLTLIGLAALAVPRVVAHDLDLVGPVVNSVLVFVPIAIWLAVVLWNRAQRPFVALLAVGIAYGVLVAVTHQVLWNESFQGEPPALGGNLAGVLAPGAEAVVLRVFAFFSSVLTGTAVGAVTGAVGWLLAKLVPGFRPRH